MRTNRLSYSLLTMLLVTASAFGQSLDARNLGMGGAGVASSDYTGAALANPALLTRFDEGDTMALTFPSFGILATDNDGLLQAVDDFQASYDSLVEKINNLTVTLADRAELIAALANIDGKSFTARSELGFRFSVPSKGLAWSLSLSSNLDGLVLPRIDPADIARILTSMNPADLNNLVSEISVVGASVTDLGLSVAHAFDFSGVSLGVGITPKYQRIDTYNYSVQIQNVELSDFNDPAYRSDESGLNVDIGLSLTLGGSLTFGLVGKNLVGRTVDTVVTNGRQYTYELNPLMTAGIAWQPIDLLTITGDLDLNAKERFQGIDDDVRYAAIGAEVDLWEWLMLRAGYRVDLEEVDYDLFSLGVGIGFFDTVRLDVAGLVSTNEQSAIGGEEYGIYGGAIQLTIKF
jgi:F plasmid transfer operon, TraF, protein